MTDKFIRFNPKTAKNGDTVYVNKRKPYTYIGKDAFNRNASVIQNEEGYSWDDNDCLTVKAPKKTMWINVYRQGVACYWYGTETAAKDNANKGSGAYIGTYPLKIDDVA